MKCTKVPVLLKKNHIEKFETQNLSRGTTALVLHRSYEQGERQNIDVKV